MSTTMGVRLSDEEKALVDAAAEAEAEVGDRGGPSAWARKVILKEAKRVLEAQTMKEPG